jgi:hypothetical protein
MTYGMTLADVDKVLAADRSRKKEEGEERRTPPCKQWPDPQI